jgi:hypothetical protein
VKNEQKMWKTEQKMGKTEQKPKKYFFLGKTNKIWKNEQKRIIKFFNFKIFIFF